MTSLLQEPWLSERAKKVNAVMQEGGATPLASIVPGGCELSKHARVGVGSSPMQHPPTWPLTRSTEGQLTWLVRDPGWEQEPLLGRGCRCQGTLVMREDGDHQRRHVTLDLLNGKMEEIRHWPNTA